MAKAKKAVPEGHHTVTPQLTLDNTARAIDWYKKALGAEEVARAVGPDGKIMHAEIRIGDSLIMLNDEIGGGKSPKAIGGSPASLWIYVEDCDSLFNRAVAAGGAGASRTDGADGRPVLGRSRGYVHRSAWLSVDHRDAQGGSDTAGDEAAHGRLHETRGGAAGAPVISSNGRSSARRNWVTAFKCPTYGG